MKRPMDAVGNELFVDDRVAITMPQGVYIMGKIVAVEEGGLLVTGRTPDPHNALQIPCTVRVLVDISLHAQPGSCIVQLLKAVVPDSAKTTPPSN